MWLTTLLFRYVLAEVKQDKQDKCYGISFQGGGAHGSYEVGALKAIIELVPDEERQWDVISGVSVGSNIALIASQHPKGEEASFVQQLEQVMDSLNPLQLFSLWDCDIKCWLLDRPAIVNSAPQKDFLLSLLKKPIQRKVSATAVEANNVIYQPFVFGPGDDIEFYVQTVMASSALYGYLPYQLIGDGVYVDGGTIASLDSGTPILECLKLVENQSDITIDLIYDYNAFNYQYDEDLCTYRVIELVEDIQKQWQKLRYYEWAKLMYPQVHFRYVIIPSEPLGSMYDITRIEENKELGYKDATNVIKNGFNIKNLDEFYYQAMRPIKAEQQFSIKQ